MIFTASDLTQRASAGDRETFAELVRIYQSGVYNVTYRMLGEQRGAEDAAQETFLRAFRAMHTFDPSRPPGPWLKKIAVNVCLNRLERQEPLNLDEQDLDSLGDPHWDNFPPEAQVIALERNRLIRAVLMTLPPRYRAIIELRYFEELNYTEIAETLQRPLSDVKSDLFRARRFLASKLKELL